MKKTITLTAQVIVIAGALVTFSASSASAHSEIPKSDRGRSCWAHSRHTDHKHEVGHSHADCGGSPSPTTSVPASPVTEPVSTGDDTASAPIASDSSATPSTSVATVPAASEATPVSTDAPAAETAPVVPATPAENGLGDVNTEIETRDGDTATVSPQPNNELVASPSRESESVSKSLPTTRESEIAGSTSLEGASVVGSAVEFSWWWLLILLAVAAEGYRRYRRAQKNRMTATDEVAVA